MIKYLSIAILLIIASVAFAQKAEGRALSFSTPKNEDKDYQDYIRVVEFMWDEYSKAKDFEAFQQQQNAEFQAFVRKELEAYRKYVEEVKQKWNEFIDSTKQHWVSYSEDKSVRSIVDFEGKMAQEKDVRSLSGNIGSKGQIIVEAVVPADAPDAADKAKELIASHIEKLFSADNEAKANILEGQVKTKTGESVTSQNAKEFVKEEVMPEVKVTSRSLTPDSPSPRLLLSGGQSGVRGKDGVERIKASVAIPMVPEHLRARAEQYRLHGESHFP